MIRQKNYLAGAKKAYYSILLESKVLLPSTIFSSGGFPSETVKTNTYGASFRKNVVADSANTFAFEPPAWMNAPDFQITWNQDGHEVRGAITQTAPYYRATLQIEIEGDRDRRSLHSVKVGGVRTEFRFPANFRVRSVILDPHYLVLRWTPEYRAAADAARLQGAPSL